jgi:hypothetical protein
VTGRIPELAEVAEDIQAIQTSLVSMNSKLDLLDIKFLPREVYEERHKALRTEVALEMASLRQHTDSARRLSMWALGVLCTLVMGALVGFLVTGGPA